MSHSVTLLMGADNLAPHCSEANLRESRERYESIKLVWAFTAGGCTDVIAGPNNNLVQKEKLLVRQKYRADIRKRSHAWRKTAADGGFTETQRRFYYAKWVSEARQEFLENENGDIWHRHQEVGFILACDGSEDSKLRFRDGINARRCF